MSGRFAGVPARPVASPLRCRTDGPAPSRVPRPDAVFAETARTSPYDGFGRSSRGVTCIDMCKIRRGLHCRQRGDSGGPWLESIYRTETAGSSEGSLRRGRGGIPLKHRSASPAGDPHEVRFLHPGHQCHVGVAVPEEVGMDALAERPAARPRSVTIWAIPESVNRPLSPSHSHGSLAAEWPSRRRR